MNRRILSAICVLALLLIPASYSWAQSSTTPTQQDQINRSDDNRSDQDVNRDSEVNHDNSIKADTNRDVDLEKPSTTTEQNVTQDQNQNRSVTESQPKTQSETSSSTTQTEGSREGLPATAGELPLLAFIGILSLASAAGTRYFARARR
jgi:hypothetical protein